MLLALHPGLVDVGVVAGDLLDDAHDLGVVAVALEVAAVGPEDAFALAQRCRVDLGVVVGGRGEQGLLGLGDLPEDLLLGIEVVVEGSVREAGLLGDVGDPGLEEAGLLEDVLGGLEQAGPGLGPLPRTRCRGGRFGGLGLGHVDSLSRRAASGSS